MSPRFALIPTLFLLASCPRPPPPARPPPPSERDVLAGRVKALSAEAEALIRTQDELIWAHWMDGAPLDIAKSYEGHDALFTPDNVKLIDRLRQLATEPTEHRALTHLMVHFVGEYLAHALSDQTEAIGALEASVSYSASGRDFLYRDLEHDLATEKSSARRQSLYDAATPAVERLSALHVSKRDRAAGLLRELGYASPEAYAAQLREADLEDLASLADHVLQLTQAPYEKILAQLAPRELQVPFAKLRRSDLPRLFHVGQADKTFAAGVEIPRAKDTLKGLGIDLSTVRGLKVDDRELPKKNHRPLAVAVRIPDDVRLSLVPAAGAHAAASLFHELGHALHFSFAQQTRFELAKLGNRTAYEAFARVLEDLVDDPVWLQQAGGPADDKVAEHLAATSAYRLYQVRLQAAHVLYDMQVSKADVADAKALYTAVFSRALALPLDAAEQARFVVDEEDFFAAADALRASFLAAQIEAQLKARFGPAWWRQAEAGTYLEGLWSPANAVSAVELAHRLGEPRIEPDQLLLRLTALLKVQMPLPSQPTPADVGTAPDAGT